MKTQVIAIHGGEAFDTYDDYISYLKNSEISLEKFKPRKGWRDTLMEKLDDSYEVLLPQMPNKTNARYEEWKLYFERIIPFLSNDIILIGNSLGGIFLAKYLSKNIISKKIKATILVAAPFDNKNSKYSLSGFVLPASLNKFAEQSEKIFLIQSKDDPIVLFEQLGKYKKLLPNAKEIILDGRGHFNQESFPEIIDLIKSL
jgi:predicted alpha/beta hydrolase family esterase